uniref:Odorant receptor n=1 Tax=Trichogramma kaykai TaxID=54128 RepID=A0ABD2X2N8_9HYME
MNQQKWTSWHASKETWRYIILIEKLAGCWPYQYPRVNSIVRVFNGVMLVSLLVPIVCRLLIELDCVDMDIQLVIENTFVSTILSGVLIKFIALYINEKQREEVYHKMTFKTLKITNNQETQVMNYHSRAAPLFLTKILLCVGLTTMMFETIPLANMNLEYYLQSNLTFKIKQLPMYAEYFVDQEKYFYALLFHMFVSSWVAVFINISFDASFVLIVHNHLALYKIVRSVQPEIFLNSFLKLSSIIELLFSVFSMRLREASKNDDNNVCYRKTIPYEHEIRGNIINAIEIHQTAIEITNTIEKAFSVPLFLLTVQNMSTFGGLLVLVMTTVRDPVELFRYFVTFAGVLSYFSLFAVLGEKVITNSTTIFRESYTTNWKNHSKPLTVLFRIIMMRSMKPVDIKGGSLVLGMQTLGQFFQQSFLYILFFRLFRRPA